MPSPPRHHCGGALHRIHQGARAFAVRDHHAIADQELPFVKDAVTTGRDDTHDSTAVNNDHEHMKAKLEEPEYCCEDRRPCAGGHLRATGTTSSTRRVAAPTTYSMSCLKGDRGMQLKPFSLFFLPAARVAFEPCVCDHPSLYH